ncbi:MAG TPA: hypothetical protein PKN96_00730 [Flavobacterium sp.]|uniref:hypothetical protein n=1 Tax=Flavobacterium sp. TaxID=239 RepID=UPI002C97DD09|nr:hypothetical protein [Flavobacterium sp.]HNP31795.1 hypothetical protein [Flavobacterium sp.]
MKQIEKIFLHTVQDLGERSEMANIYTILRASGMIRQLLVDNNSLLDQINRDYKEKILFRVQSKPDVLMERFDENGKKLNKWFGINFIFPDKDSKDVELLKKDDFFKYKLLSFGEHEFSVLEVIKICANKYGGIHSEDIKDEREQLLDRLNSSFALLNFDCVFYSMHGIMRVCNEALLPLSKRIESKYYSK